MLHSVRNLQGFSIAAEDGEIGKIDDILFDDEKWTIRYLVVDTGSWLSGRKVLISPISFLRADWPNGVMHVRLTQQQVRDSPGIDTDQPVSRQQEAALHQYYDYAPYWHGPHLWGYTILAPIVESRTYDDHVVNDAEQARQRGIEHDSHLRSAKDVMGHHIQATDDAFGQVGNFLFDDHDWSIRFIVIDTAHWLPGKDVLISPQRIDHVSWAEKSVYVNATRKEVESSQEYDSLNPPAREREQALYRHS